MRTRWPIVPSRLQNRCEYQVDRFTHGMWSFGATSPSDYLHKASRFTLAERIRCPTLVCDAEGDLFFKGQPQQLFDHLTCPKQSIHFTRDDGAGAHCEIGAARLAPARMFNWLDETLAKI